MTEAKVKTPNGFSAFFQLKERVPNKQYEKKYLFLSVFCSRLRLKPNLLSCLALFSAILTGGFFLRDFLELAALFCWLTWFFSHFDGIYARQTASESRFGGFFDAIVNIACDLFLLVSLTIKYLFAANYVLALVLLGLLALRALIMTVRAELKIFKIKNTESFYGRAEFWLVFTLGILLDRVALAAAISFFLFLLNGLQLGAQSFVLYKTSPRPPVKQLFSRGKKKHPRKHRSKK
ncbi:MAG: CDP-alcohol phosphatidyltransferase family protein [Candidatus Margulisbacteria bacterium]|jgi:phosphatidylglycerophosphate synthase|nr:CDP-alcohol phosphatidyltransferase family protein [Candidatus Margulisiibacteriota bacterium]